MFLQAVESSHIQSSVVDRTLSSRRSFRKEFFAESMSTALPHKILHDRKGRMDIASRHRSWHPTGSSNPLRSGKRPFGSEGLRCPPLHGVALEQAQIFFG